MTDPIKAALEAGAAALCVVQGVGQTPNEMARARVEAAAVVAAVLRALPRNAKEYRDHTKRALLWEAVFPDNLAAAVEAAARGESNTSPPSC